MQTETQTKISQKAAREMLAALYACMGMIRRAETESGCIAYLEARQAAEAAIARAEGRS